MRKKSRHKTRFHKDGANPVAKALLLAKADSLHRTLGCQMMLLQDGEPCRDVLCFLAWSLQIGARMAAHYDPRSETTRLFYEAGREVARMVETGEGWRRDCAERYWELACSCHHAIKDDPRVAAMFFDEASLAMKLAEAGLLRADSFAKSEMISPDINHSFAASAA